LLRLADLKANQSTWIDPVSANYRGVDVFELPPNGQGIAALQILNILENYDIAKMGFSERVSSEILWGPGRLAGTPSGLPDWAGSA